MHIAHKVETSYKVHQDTLAVTEEERDLGMITTANMKMSTQCAKAAAAAMHRYLINQAALEEIEKKNLEFSIKALSDHIQIIVFRHSLHSWRKIQIV